jgi:hypothetical protein
VLTRFRRTFLAGAAAGTLLLAFSQTVAAHGHISAAGFEFEIGWATEPTLLGQPNGVALFVHDADEKPVTDIPADAIKVVVSTAGQDSPSLNLTPAFDAEEGFGTPGEYTADIIPTAPGDYTFHFTGTIHGKPIDISMTSSEETFDAVVSASDLEFPVKQPTLAEVGTRLDRIDARIDALQSAAPAAKAIADAQAAAATASASADRALLIGGLLGGAGLIIGVVALIVAMRARRPAG